MIGCSGKNYPGFPVHNGLFDEDYLAKIPSYPSMNQRYGYYMNALQWIVPRRKKSTIHILQMTIKAKKCNWLRSAIQSGHEERKYTMANFDCG